jgi:hypothetical protein
MPQITYGLPEFGLGGSYDDLGGGGRIFLFARAEYESPTPDPIFGAANGDSQIDQIRAIPNGGEIVDDRFAGIVTTEPSRPCHVVHQGWFA